MRARHTDIAGGESSELERLRQAVVSLGEMIARAPVGIFVADLDGRYTDVNPAGCEMLGRTRDEIVGFTIVDLIPPEQVPKLAESRARLVAGATDVAEWLLKRGDGTYLPVEVSARIIPDGRWQGFVRDISERKEAEEALAASEARFRQIVSSAADGIIMVDAEQRIVLYNEAARRIFGHEPDAIRGQPLSVLIPEPYRAGHRERVLAFGAGRASGRSMADRQPIRALRADGAEFLAQIAISRGAVRGEQVFTAVVRDVSHEVRALEEERFVAELSAILAASLDLDEMLAELGRRVAEQLADVCLIDLVEGSTTRRAHVATRDRDRTWLASALGAYPRDRSHPHLGEGVWHTHQPELVPEVDDAYLRCHTQGEEHLTLLQAIGPRSMIAVPMTARGRLLGILVMLSTGRSYEQRDVALAATVAGRAAMALDNVRLHDALLRANADLRAHVRELMEAQERIRTLTGLLPMCAWCGRIRDEDSGGEWRKLEHYVSEHSAARFTHGICPDCVKRFGTPG